jgi:hypothetical protein
MTYRRSGCGTDGRYTFPGFPNRFAPMNLQPLLRVQSPQLFVIDQDLRRGALVL